MITSFRNCFIVSFVLHFARPLCGIGIVFRMYVLNWKFKFQCNFQIWKKIVNLQDSYLSISIFFRFRQFHWYNFSLILIISLIYRVKYDCFKMFNYQYSGSWTGLTWWFVKEYWKKYKYCIHNMKKKPKHNIELDIWCYKCSFSPIFL